MIREKSNQVSGTTNTSSFTEDSLNESDYDVEVEDVEFYEEGEVYIDSEEDSDDVGGPSAFLQSELLMPSTSPEGEEEKKVSAPRASLLGLSEELPMHNQDSDDTTDFEECEVGDDRTPVPTTVRASLNLKSSFNLEAP